MARITFAPVVYSQYKRRDGTYTVKMRLTFKKKSRFITTSEVASAAQLTRSLAIKDQGLQLRLRELENRMRAAVSSLDMFTLEQMDVDDVLAYMNKHLNGDFRLDFLAFWPEAVADKAKGSRDNYMIALRSFKRFLGTDTLDISKVTSRLMREYEAYLVKRHGKGARAVTMYTAAVKHVHTLARKKYNDDEFGEELIRNPFEFYNPPKSTPPDHRDIDPAIIQGMIENRKSLTGRERRAVDAFLLSFGLMGMNACDLLTCKPPKDGVLVYNRRKTMSLRPDKALMKVKIEDAIKPIYEEWKDNDGQHAFIFHRFHENNRQMNAALSKGLAKYKARMGIVSERMDFYSARHTWSTLAFSLGIHESLVNDCLCHKNAGLKVTDIYINKDWSVMWDANSKVLAQFDWHQ